MKLDLHIHSRHSDDGSESVRDIIRTARERGLDGIAICDHNTFEAFEEAKSLAPEGFVVIPGVEYSTDVGHVLALFVTKQYDLKRNEKNYRVIESLRSAADEDGALLVAAHPYRKREALPERLLPNVDGVEVENSRDAYNRPENSRRSRQDARDGGKFMTGGSDSHILHELGACYTVLPDDTERSADGVKNALLQRLSDAEGKGGRLRDQAISKLRITKPRKLFKDIARLVVFTVRDIRSK